MKKFLFFICILLASSFIRTHAQSLANTSWKGLVPQFNDSLTIHFKTDSSYVTSSSGEVLVKSTIHITNEVLTLDDYDGPHACHERHGVYKYFIKGNTLSMELVTDSCDGRQIIAEILWVKTGIN